MNTVKVKTQELYFALSFLRYTVPVDPHLPALAYIKVIPSPTHLNLYAVSEQSVAGIEIPVVECTETESFTVHFTTLQRLIGVYSKECDVVEISTKDKNKHIILYDGKGSKQRVSTGILDDYPDILVLSGNNISIIPNELISLLDLSKYTGNVMEKLSYAHLVCNGDTLTVEATDGFSGGYGDLPITHTADFDICVPSIMERPLKKMATVTLDDELWKLIITGNHLYVIGEYWFIGFSLLNTPYPNIENAYKNDNLVTLKIDISELEYALNVVTVNSDNNKITLHLKGDTINVSTTGNSSSKIELVNCDFKGDVSIILDIKNFRKIISSLKETEITLQVGKYGEPLIIPEANRIYFIIPFTS